MKFIHCTDLHIMGRNPLYRKDNYLETIKEKIKWINSYAESVDARGILCTGDRNPSRSKRTERLVS